MATLPHTRAFECSDFERIIDLYLDDELDDAERFGAEAHLEGCEECQLQLDKLTSLQIKVRESGEHAPHTFKSELLERLESQPLERSWLSWRATLALAASALLVGGGIVFLAPEALSLESTHGLKESGSLRELKESDEIAEEALDWHTQKLPLDVTGPNIERVDGWFEERLGHTVKIPEFKAKNVDLLGGRLARVRNRHAALLTLKVDNRKLSLIVVPQQKRVYKAHKKTYPLIKRERGYNIVVLRQGDTAYGFVSDLPRPQMQQLVHQVSLRH